ncbi:beta-glucosidase 24-like [Carex rostrata]
MEKLPRAYVLLVSVIVVINCSWLGVNGELRRSGFPKDFIFGTASSAYQYEGATREGGRGASIWDTYTHLYPEKIANGSNGDVAIDSYHRYKEDVAIMKEMGLNSYRFSISWPRILPRGNISGGVSYEGIMYYNNLINELILNGIQPFVTLFHWDLPQALEDLYGGFLSSRIVYDFQDYAEICFQEFGDRVKNWISLNEPWSYSVGGYSTGILAPGRCSQGVGTDCLGGDSSKEPYIVAHNQLLAHAAAVVIYRKKFKESQKGKIGITLVSNWMIPYSNSKADKESAARALDFMYGWFMDPITRGEYPHRMRKLVGDRLPKFTREQSDTLKGSFDFVGVNYYTARFTSNIPISSSKIVNKSYDSDQLLNQTVERNGIIIGQKAASSWLYVYPKGIRDLLVYTKKTYNNPIIYITENGVDETNDKNLSLEESLKDDFRIKFYQQHLSYVQSAIREGVNVRGYFAWSLFDNFEWMDGFSVRFGINFVDYKNRLKRYPKSSSLWFRGFLKDNP